MSHTQLTDEPCPKCGASLDIKVVMPSSKPDSHKGAAQQRETVRIKRIKLCPECGWYLELPFGAGFPEIKR